MILPLLAELIRVFSVQFESIEIFRINSVLIDSIHLLEDERNLCSIQRVSETIDNSGRCRHEFDFELIQFFFTCGVIRCPTECVILISNYVVQQEIKLHTIAQLSNIMKLFDALFSLIILSEEQFVFTSIAIFVPSTDTK